MALVDMNPGNLGGVLVLLLVFAALLPAFNTGVQFIADQTSGITEQLAVLIIPLVLIAIAANLWDSSGRPRR